MTILGIETSDDYVGLGLADDDGILISRASEPEMRNKNVLNLMLKETLDLAKTNLKNISGIAVSIGPGSFTGLRVGLAAAKGICWSRNIPLAGVSSTEAIAACIDPFEGNLLAVKDARRNEYYFGGFEGSKGGWSRILPDKAGDRDEIIDILSQGFKIAGRLSQIETEIVEIAKANIIEYDPGRVAGMVAHLGYMKLRAGKTLDFKSASPQYIRDPGIGRQRG